jgi:hypothetical protein
MLITTRKSDNTDLKNSLTIIADKILKQSLWFFFSAEDHTTTVSQIENACSAGSAFSPAGSVAQPKIYSQSQSHIYSPKCTSSTMPPGFFLATMKGERKGSKKLSQL